MRRISLLSECPVQEWISCYEFFISNGQGYVSSDLFIFLKNIIFLLEALTVCPGYVQCPLLESSIPCSHQSCGN